MKQKLEIIDFLRGFSIFIIVLMHLFHSYEIPSSFHRIIGFAGAGIHVFILCSGFGLYLSYLYRPLSYADFLRRRLSKIYLPYIIIVFLTTLWNLNINGVCEWGNLLSHVFLYKMFISSYDVS